jgi:hypothetical protein
MDIAPLGAGFGGFDGQLIVAGEKSGLFKAVDRSGTITVITADPINTPEKISFVPMNVGTSGSVLEGLYSANYPLNVVRADANGFTTYKGDAIVTTELSDHRISRMHWEGSRFETNVIGTSTGQAEDGFFLTPAMLNVASCPAPHQAPKSPHVSRALAKRAAVPRN